MTYTSPFDPANEAGYQRWRERKLETAPTDIQDLIVEVGDPRHLTDAEREAILERCRRANLAIYASRVGEDPDKAIPASLGARFGLNRLDHNRGADEDAITSLRVQTDARHREYIPYSDRPIAWHTDGYYNEPEHWIHGLILHCVHPADHGGANDLLDHELVYLRIRDEDPELIRALMHPECMSVPAHSIDGELVRGDRPGPVFSIRADGGLHMRYTNRGRNILWRNDALTAEAVRQLRQVLHSDTPWHFTARLESGWGLICNNVLHTRSGFTDGATPRLLYRARYYDRIQGT